MEFKSVPEGSEEFCIIYKRLLTVGTECKCELLYQHENIEVLGCNIPKYIKKGCSGQMLYQQCNTRVPCV